MLIDSARLQNQDRAGGGGSCMGVASEVPQPMYQVYSTVIP